MNQSNLMEFEKEESDEMEDEEIQAIKGEK